MAAMNLITRSDFDGLVCAVLLRSLNLVDQIRFVEPGAVQEGRISVNENDIVANLPFAPGCGMWFDHHYSEQERLDIAGQYVGVSRSAPSAASLIYNYYNDPRLVRFEELVKFTDKADSARFSAEEIAHPSGWVLLAFICDPRTGLEHGAAFSHTSSEFMSNLVNYVSRFSIDEILEQEEVRERVVRYKASEAAHRDYIKEHSKYIEPLVLTDLRNSPPMPPGNRYVVYSLFPQANISMRITNEVDNRVTISVGYSILNRTSRVNVGAMLLQFGGGGHRQVGTCQVEPEEADEVIRRVTQQIVAA